MVALMWNNVLDCRRTIQLTEELGAMVVETKKGRARQMNAGVAAASGDSCAVIPVDHELFGKQKQ